MTGNAAGRVLLAGQDAGSGFAITRDRALTAGHVVRAAAPMAAGRPGPADGPAMSVLVVDGGEPGEAGAVVEYRPEGVEPIPVTRIEVDTRLDVAVLHLQRPAPAVLLAAAPATTGDGWRVDTRPNTSDPGLTGTVTYPHLPFRNEAGKETILMQLRVREEAGDYRGYSGSPVIAEAGGVLGVLVEQGRWRISAQVGQTPPVGNWLLAAPIDQVLAEFDLARASVARPVGDIPQAVSFEVRRPELLAEVIDALTGSSPEGRLVGLAGMGGAGKSVLAAAAARDPKVAEAFPGGRFWLELGLDPPLLQLQASLAAALGSSTPVTDVPQGRALLSRLLAERRCLLVVDNVQDQAHLPAFNVVGSAGWVLATAREADALPGATIIPLGELAEPAAMQLLAGWAGTRPDHLPAEAAQVAAECVYLPLALALCGAMIADGSHTWAQLLGLLCDADLDEFRSRLIDYPHPSLALALGASLSTLHPDARDRYLRLAVFRGQGPVPPATLGVLWGLDQQHTTALIGDLAGKSLLHVEADRVSLHDLQMDYLVGLTPDLRALHARLLTAYRDQCPGGWATGPDDGYFYQHLAHHLQQAGRTGELQGLLLDLNWMNTKLATGTMTGLLADYDLTEDPLTRQIPRILRRSAASLAADPEQLRGHLAGRLIGHPDPGIDTWARELASQPGARTWLAPLTPALAPATGPLQQILTAHTGWVHSVAVTPDGATAFSGGADGTVRVWDLVTGKLRATLTGHTGNVYAVAVTPDGATAFSGGADGTVRVWDLVTGKLRATLTGHTSRVSSVAVTPDGTTAVSAGGHDKTVRVWDLVTGKLRATLTGHTGSVSSVAVTPDGTTAVSGDEYDETVRVWDLTTGRAQAKLTGKADRVYSVAITADGTTAVSGGDDQKVTVWDVATGQARATLKGQIANVFAVAVTPDGTTAVSGDNGAVWVWDLATGQPRAALTGHDLGVRAVAVTPDGITAVSGGDDRTVRVWDLTTSQPPATYTGQGDSTRSMAVAQDGTTAVSGSLNGTMRVWDLATGQPRATLGRHIRAVESVAVTADGATAVSGGKDGKVYVWDLVTGRFRATLKGPTGLVLSVAVTPDGTTAVSTDGTVYVWDLATGQLRVTFTVCTGHGGHTNWVSAVAVTPDGTAAVGGSADGTVYVWDLVTGQPRAALTGHGGHTNWVSAVAVTPDGTTAVSGSHHGTVYVWDLVTGQPRAALTGHTGVVGSVGVTPDGTTAVSGGDDRTVRVWDLATGQQLARWDGDSAVAGCTVLQGKPLKIGIRQQEGPPYLLELRTQQPT